MSETRMFCAGCGAPRCLKQFECPECGHLYVQHEPKRPEPKRRDLTRARQGNRETAANVVLQLHAHVDPDSARDLADRVVRAIDRAGRRGHSAGAATADEVERAYAELVRRDVPTSREDVRAALDAALAVGVNA